MDTVFFWKAIGQYGAFSQWYMSDFTIDGIVYSSAEQYMMAMKANIFNDFNTQRDIMLLSDTQKIKALGRKVSGFNPQLWDSVKFDIVVDANMAKFSANSKLQNLLLNTGYAELVEASPYDAIWGIGLVEDDPRIDDRANWGENLLGKALGEVRKRMVEHMQQRIGRYQFDQRADVTLI